jgi:hypothetical protein
MTAKVTSMLGMIPIDNPAGRLCCLPNKKQRHKRRADVSEKFDRMNLVVKRLLSDVHEPCLEISRCCAAWN